MRDEILRLLNRRDTLSADPRARSEWMLAALELLLRAELMRQQPAKGDGHERRTEAAQGAAR